MSMQKITEKTQATEVSASASVLITQRENIDGTPTESLRRATLEAFIAALRTNGINSGYVTAQTLQGMYSDLVKSVETSTNGITITYWNNSTEEIPISSGGLAFDEITCDADGTFHILMNGEDVVEPCQLVGGGGGTSDGNTLRISNGMGSRALTIMSSVSDYSMLASWSSKDSDGQVTGPGTASWYVNNVRVAVQNNVAQGNLTFPIRQYLSTGVANNVALTIEDRDGYSKTFSWTVTVSNVGLSWNIDDIAYHGSESLTIRITPSGVGVKTIVVTIDDDTEHPVYSQTLGTNNNNTQVFTIPAQEHGEHIIKADMSIVIDGDTVNTPTLEHTGVWVESGETDKIVAVHKSVIETTQFETIPVKYIAIDPTLSNADDEITVKIKEGNTVVSELGIKMSEMTDVQMFPYRATAAGNTTLTVVAGESPNTESDSVVVSATSIGYEINPVTAGLIMELDPTGHSNSEANRASFGYKDGNGTNHPLSFSSDFDWQNGGFRQDDDGVTAFVIKRGNSVTFDRSLFLASDNTNGEAGTAGTGKHISMIFKTVNVTDYDTKIAHSYDSNVGIELFAHNATFRAGNAITCQYCEDYKVELSLNINPENASMKFWVAGTPAKGNTFLASGNTKTQFVQGNPDSFTIGSDDCDIWIYRFKMYRTYLEDREVLQNFIADCGNPTEMIARYLRNDIYVDGNIDISKLMTAAPELHIITIETAGFPGDKGSAGNTPCKIIHQIGNGVDEDQWYAENAQYTLQGTSSMNYRQVAGNLENNMKKTTMKVSRTQETLNGYAMTANSVPVKYFNLKANVASSENANNRCAAELFNIFNPLVSKAKSENSKVRDTVEGHPCAVFIKNTGNSDLLLGVPGARTIPANFTILYFVGDMNNSKKNTEVFGQTGEWDDANHAQCCIEFLENTYTRCTFKTHDFENEGWKEDGTQLTSHFEFRYPDGAGTQAMKDNFIAMHAWVCSTDPEGATGANLDVNDRFGVYTKDTAEYRRAKFRREVGDYFNLSNLLFYYLFTEFFLGVDNRAKNMFLSYEPDENDEWRWNVSKFYDGDTILGIDNKGNFVWGEAYGIEDTDGYEEEVDGQTVTRPYFNAAESVLWCNVRDCFPEELAAAYNIYENAGLFTAAYLSNMFDTYQRLRPEALMVEDYAGKYDAPITNANTASWMVDMEHGEKRLQRRQFLIYQEKYMSSKYVSAKAKADIIRYQAKPGANFSSAIEMTPYSDMYVGFLRDNTPAGKQRLKKGQTATVQCLDGNGNPLVLQSGELNIMLINGSNLKHIDGAEYLYPGQVSITNGAKLQDIILGDIGYTSANLASVAFGTVPLVKVIDLRGQTGISGIIDLSGCTLLEELKLAGTGSSEHPIELTLPQTKTLRLLALGTNISKLVARNIPTLTSANFSCSAANLTAVWIENAPGINTATLLAEATNLVRGRVTNVDWSLTDADLLMHLATLKGYDAQGNPLETAGSFYLGGEVDVEYMTEGEYNTLHAAFPDLTINIDNIVETHTVTFKNYDGTVLNTQTVRDGGAARNPISSGLIQTPTKAPTTDLVYTFVGWDKSISNITEDTVVTATYSSATRRYTVRWYYDSTTLLYSEQVDAHGSTAYDGADLTPPAGKYWLGWDALTNDITADTDVTARFITPVLPDQVAASYDYLYSDDPNDDSLLSIEEFFGVLENGRAKDYFRVGDLIKIVPSTNAFADTSIVMVCAGFNHYKLADGSGNFAQAVFVMKGIMNASRQMNSTNTNTTSWKDCSMRAFLRNTVFPALPRQWQVLIKNVNVLTSAGNTSDNIITTEDNLFLLSYAEVGFEVNSIPYTNEVDASAEQKTFGIFTDNNSRIKKTYNGGGSASHWWLRSPLASGSTSFCYVGTNGSAYTNLAGSSYGVAFSFCL